MSKRTIFILASAVAVLAVLFIAADSEAFFDRMKKDTDAKKTGEFRVQGKFSGSIMGEITIGKQKQKVWITKNTAIYNAERGSASAGLRVSNRDVYVAGKWKEGVRVASIVYVKARNDKKGVRDAQARFRVQSDANEDVGYFTDEIAR